VAVRFAVLRAKARRRALVQLTLATTFLVGALAYALGPDRHERTGLLWMTGLFFLSTIQVASGLSTFARLGRKPRRAWLVPTVAWGLLSLLVLGYLVRR
jgi:hypothetical protein